jgi:hypothetical protein
MADVLIVNAATGERIERDFTPEELAEREAYAAAEAERAALEAEQQAAHEAALESGKAKLLALGLTEDEVAAMTSG